MLSVNVGPFNLAMGHLILMLAFAVALVVGAIAGRRYRAPVTGPMTDILLAALVTARAAFVIRYIDQYRDSPLGMLDIRDGGFDVLAGVLGALLMTAFVLWRKQALRIPLGQAVVVGAMVWGVTSGLLALIEGQNRSLPEVTVTDSGGDGVRLSAVGAGQPRVINLWATWCPPCVREMPVLQEAQNNFPEVAFIFVNQGEGAQTIEAFLQAQSLSLTNSLRDVAGALPRAVGSHGLPTTLFYDADGRLVDTHVGELSGATLKRGMDRFDPRYLERRGN